MADIFGFGQPFNPQQNVAPQSLPPDPFGFGQQPQPLSQHQLNAYKTLLDLSSPQERAQRLQELQQAAGNNAAAAQLHNTFQGYNQNQAQQGYQPSFGDQANSFAVSAVENPVQSANNLTQIGLGGLGMVANAGAHLVGNQGAINATNQFIQGTVGATPWVQQANLDRINGATNPQIAREVVGNSLNDAANVMSVVPVGRGINAGLDVAKTGLKGLGNATKEAAIANVAPSVGMGTGQALLDPNNKTPLDVARSAAMNSLGNEAAGTALSVAGFGAGRGIARAAQVGARGLDAAGSKVAQSAQRVMANEGGYIDPSARFGAPDLKTPQGISDHINYIQSQLDAMPERMNAIRQQIDTNPTMPAAVKVKTLRAEQDNLNAEANALKAEQAHHLQTLNSMGYNHIPEASIPKGVPLDTPTLPAEVAPKQTIGEKIGTGIGVAARNVADSFQTHVLQDEGGALDPNATIGKEKPLGEQIGRLKAAIAKETDPNTKVELSNQLKALNKQFSAEKNAASSKTTDPNVIADALGLKPEDRVPTAKPPIGNPLDKPIEEQPKLSAEERRAIIKQDYQQTKNHVDMTVDEGNIKGAIAKSQGVADEADQRLREAQALGRKLNDHDRNLLYRVENGEDVRTVAKDAQKKKSFTEAATKLADAFDYNLAALRAAGSLTFKQHDYIIPHYYEATPEMMDKLEIKPEDRVTFGKKQGFHDKSAKYDSYIKAEKVGLHPLYDNPMDAVNKYRAGAGSYIRQNGLYEALKHAAPGQVADLGTVSDNAGTKYKQAAGRLPFNASDAVNNALKNFQDTKISNPYVRAGYNAARTVNGMQKALLFFGAPFHYMNITKNFLGLTTTTGHELIAGQGVANALRSALEPKGYAKVIESARADGTLAFARESLGMQISGSHVDYRPDTLKGNAQAMLDKVNIFGATHRNMNNFIDAYGLTLARAAKNYGVKPGSEDAIKLGHEYNMVIGRLNGVVDGHNPFLDKFISDGALAPQYLRSQLGLVKDAAVKTATLEGSHGAGIYNAGDVARSTVVGTRVFQAALAITASAIATGQMPTLQKMINEAGLNPNNPNPNIQLTSKNKSGHGQVMNLPTDPAGLVAGLVTDPLHFGQARTSPALAAAQRFATNTDWNGNQIADPNASNYNQKKLAGALAGNLPIGVQNLMGAVSGKLTPGQAVAQEFGGRTKTDPNDPAVQQAAAHFAAVKQFTSKLGANDLATYNAINPQSKMADGSYTPASAFDPSKAPEKTLALLGHPSVLSAMIKINQASSSHDPMWDLNNTDKTAVAGDGSPATPLQVFMEHQVHQGTDYQGAQSKEDIKNNPWITDLNQSRSQWFATLPKSQNPSSQNPLQYPTIDPQTQALMTQESQITNPAEKSAFINAHPELNAAYQQISDYTNARRAQEGATPFAQAPVASPQVQAAMNAKQWNAPGVQAFLNANSAFKIAGPFGDGIGGAGGGRNTSQSAIANVSQGLQANGKVAYSSSGASARANARNKIKNAISSNNRNVKYDMKKSRQAVHKIAFSPHTKSLGNSHLGAALLKGITMPQVAKGKGRKLA